MLKHGLWIAAAISLAYPSFSRADYPAAKSNYLLAEELQHDSQRLLPVTDHFAFGLDGTSAIRTLGSKDFYHGVMYWLQARSEARLNPYFRANLRSILYAGSISYGYVRASNFYNLLGLAATWPSPVAGGTLTVRALDLGRQTFGVGLLVQDKEINGTLLEWARDEFSFLFRVDGTGVFVLEDDTYDLELSLFRRGVGIGATYWNPESDTYRKPYFYAFSTRDYGFLGYDAEAGIRGEAFGGLLALRASAALPDVAIGARLEARRYGAGFAQGFAGQVQQQYVSYDQLNKSYTNATNIFVTGDDVTVLAAQLNLKWRFNPMLYVESLNEIGQFYFDAAPNQFYYFYRVGLGIQPIKNREEAIVAYASNKILYDSWATPPRGTSYINAPLFKQEAYFGLELNFRL